MVSSEIIYVKSQGFLGFISRFLETMADADQYLREVEVWLLTVRDSPQPQEPNVAPGTTEALQGHHEPELRELCPGTPFISVMSRELLKLH